MMIRFSGHLIGSRLEQKSAVAVMEALAEENPNVIYATDVKGQGLLLWGPEADAFLNEKTTLDSHEVMYRHYQIIRDFGLIDNNSGKAIQDAGEFLKELLKKIS